MENAILVQGCLFGDEGKGKVVDALTEKYGATLNVRFNGGGQAAHNVVRDGIHHTFAQFGSGSLQSGVDTFLSKYMLVDPLSLMVERDDLYAKLPATNKTPRVFADYRSLIVTPFHRAVNRIKSVIYSKNNTCGMGIGECVADSIKLPNASIYFEDLYNKDILKKKLLALRGVAKSKLWEFYEDFTVRTSNYEVRQKIEKEIEVLKSDRVLEVIIDLYTNCIQYINVIPPEEVAYLFSQHKTVIFEGAQGALLHQDLGLGAPDYVTWSDTSFENAESILEELNFEGKKVKVGVTRTYTTRHGIGPFPLEITDKNSQRYELYHSLEKHNGLGEWQGSWRVGYFNPELLKQGIEILGGVDFIALTHFDALKREFGDSISGFLTDMQKDFADMCLISYGPDAKKDTTFLVDIL